MDRTLQIVLKARDEASKEIEKVGKQAGGVADLLSKSFKNAAIVSGAALGALTVEAVRAINAFSESQKVMTQTEAVLKSTGGVAGVTADQVGYLASRIQRMTGISDEAVQSAENLLLTFTNITKDTFPDAINIVADMSVALGQDLKSSAIQVGKALQDPILGVTALRRVGVNFSESQQEMIKGLVESGKLLDAQKFILKELQTEFGGSAEAAGKTFAGQLAILKNTVGDLEEELGKLIVNALGPIIPKFQQLADTLKNVVAGEEDVTVLTRTLNEEFGSLGLALGRTIEFFASHRQAAIALAGAFGGFLAISIIAAVAALLHFIGLSIPVVVAASAIGATVALLIANWSGISDFFVNIWNTVVEKFNEAKTAVGAVINGVIEWFKTLPERTWGYLYDLFVVKIPFAVGFVAGYLSTAIPQMITGVIDWFRQLPQMIGELLEAAKIAIVTKLAAAWEWISTNIPTWPGRIIGFIKSIPSRVNTIFEDTKNSALGRIRELWEGLTGWWDKIKGIIDGIKRAAEEAIGAVGRGFTAGKEAGVSGFQEGGFVPRSGLGILHAGEFVLSRDMLAGRQPVPAYVTNNRPVTVQMGPVALASELDVDSLVRRLSFALKFDSGI